MDFLFHWICDKAKGAKHQIAKKCALSRHIHNKFLSDALVFFFTPRSISNWKVLNWRAIRKNETTHLAMTALTVTRLNPDRNTELENIPSLKTWSYPACCAWSLKARSHLYGINTKSQSDGYMLSVRPSRWSTQFVPWNSNTTTTRFEFSILSYRIQSTTRSSRSETNFWNYNAESVWILGQIQNPN